MSQLKTLAGETALYGLGSIVPRTLNFFLVVLHTRIFRPEEYGAYINLYAWVAVLNVVYLFGMETAYFRFATKPGSDEKRIFRVTQTFVLGLSLLISASLVLFAGPIASAFDLPGHPEFIVWLATIMFVDAAVSIPFARLRLEKKAGLFAIAKLANVIVLVGLNLYFLLVIYDPALGIGWAMLANLLANLLYIVFFFRTLSIWRPAWDKQLFSGMFSYAYPVMLTGLAGMTNEMFSRMTLTSWLPENFYPGRGADYALGVFGACYRLSVIMVLAVQAFRFAAEPFFFSNAGDKDSPKLFARVNHYFTIVCCFILLAVVINIDILKYLLDSAYWEGLGIVPVLLAANIFLGIYYNLSVWFKLTDRTYFGTIITALGAVLTVALNYILIPAFGYVGSSWATLLCYFTMMVISYALGQKYFPIPYRVIEGAAYLLFTLLLTWISAQIELPGQVAATAFHGFVLIAFGAGVYWLEKKRWKEIS